MKFRTEFTDSSSSHIILNPEKPVMLVGSCFADNMLRRMRASLWDAQNPFGVLFNPLSIASMLNVATRSNFDNFFIKNMIFRQGDLYNSYLFDSSFSSLSFNETLSHCVDAISQCRELFEKTDTLFVTFGTAYCYFLADRPDVVVANCHKKPRECFIRRRVSIEEICNVWTDLLNWLHSCYPNLEVIFTVSPVRHLRDGFADNSRSKATLLLAVERLCEAYDFCHYFPAYEIVNDDLRDYRFYGPDLVHPSEEAVDYIWKILQRDFMDTAGKETLKAGAALAARTLHRHIQPESDSAQQFDEKTQRLISDFHCQHPDMLIP